MRFKYAYNKAHQARHFVAGPPLRRLFCGLTLTLPQNNQLRSGPCARRYAALKIERLILRLKKLG